MKPVLNQCRKIESRIKDRQIKQGGSENFRWINGWNI